MEYIIKYTGQKEVEAEFFGWLQNTANLFTTQKNCGQHINSILKKDGALQLVCKSEGESIEDMPDFGNMALTLLDAENSWSTPTNPMDIDYNLPEVGLLIKQNQKMIWVEN